MFWLLIPCQGCGCTPVKPVHRQFTMYENDRLNWAGLLCEYCDDLNNQHWNELWQQYNNSRL